ncbi:MAG: hypothetical protein AVDCRST_MAG71-172 [uncultured Lysobacter sp.]|uniref:Uncharacterized protein n=1 Tax=uncultured Lysobacter sp. TaxID=271060 RepID=A0A6J4KDQ5_9GAMM|nr:MAG: hypothetical protein AVDCRST_MAG71-172 [uncultured Lysobacter sp.]
MTTSDQPAPLSVDELESLRRVARDPASADADITQMLAAKGVLQPRDGGYVLTPAGEHALNVNHESEVPGIDN